MGQGPSGPTGGEMRTHLVWVIGVLGIATILAASGPSRAHAATEPDGGKCVDCEGLTCHMTFGPAYQSCTVTPDGCLGLGECG